MIKRILVALDADSDTMAAIRYASEIAQRYDAEILGLAVVDTGHIESGARGGGIGSMYYAEKLRENLTEETRQKARELIEVFEASLEGTGITHANAVKEGVPFRRIVEDMKYHDLLIVGREPHFFYVHPEQKTKTLARVVKETSAPTFVVGDHHDAIERVLVAYDGSAASARTVQYFAHLLPFGDAPRLELLHVHRGDHEGSAFLLELMASYLDKHGLTVTKTSIRGDHPAEHISDYALESNADVIVAGAHSVSKVREWAFGSTTTALVKRFPTPMFLHH